MSGLHAALLADDFAEFHRLLVTNGMPSYPRDFHLINKALLYGRTSMAWLLVAYGCNLDMPSFRGNSPLHHAVHNNDCPDLIERMLIKGAVVSRVDPRGDTALHVAFDNNANEKIVDLLLIGHMNWSSSNETNQNGLTYLHIAASRPQMVVIQYLIEQGNADVNCRVHLDADSMFAGYTPLHMAVEHGRINVAESLLNYGADLYAKDANGSTPLHLALERRNEDMIEMLFDYDFERVNHVNRFGLSHFMAACACANTNVAFDFLLSLMVNGNCDVNETVDDSPTYPFKDYTPLLMAVEYGRLDTVRLLLANGARLTCPSQALFIKRVAVKNEYYDVARLIELYTQNYEEVEQIDA